MIPPIHDYCSMVYNFSLTKNQELELERLQARALKAIFGYYFSYRELLEKTGLSTLKGPRDARADSFTYRCLKGRFAHWFPLAANDRETRNSKEYQENFAHCTRLYFSPLYLLRRRLNDQNVAVCAFYYILTC